MYLLNVNKYKIKTNNISKIVYLKNLVKMKKLQLSFTAHLKKIKKHKNLRLFLYSKMLKFKSKNVTKYIIGVSICSNNVRIYFSNIKGKILFFCSAGSLAIKKKQRKKKIVVLKKLMKFLISKTSFALNNFLVVLHFKNLKHGLSSFVLSFLSKHYNINTVKIYNNKPHNGCRPRKIKRKKRKKLFF